MTRAQRAVDRWRRLDVVVRDLPLALALFAASLVPALRDYGTQLGDLPPHQTDALAVAVIAVECLPLALRRRWPAVSLALVVAGFAAQELLAYHLFAGTAVAVALVSAGVHLRRGRRVAVVVLTVTYVALAVALDRLGSSEHLQGSVTFYLATALLWWAGAWVRSTRAVEAERRLRAARDARVAERTDLARDLHDVVTHHVTAMVVQAEAARYLTGAPARLDEALDAVADTGRRAITDLRQLLGVLDPDPRPHAPTAGAPADGDLVRLVEQVRRAGQPVELVEETVIHGPVAVVAHRVVQEGLTNVLKHAQGAATVVRVRHDGEATMVEITNDGTGTPGLGAGSGRGLTGLRDRVGALGGVLDSGPGPDGGFVLRARIPVVEAL